PMFPEQSDAPTQPDSHSAPARRRRGGQPANQNARTHGLYSQYLRPDDAEDMPELVRIFGMNQEVALVRLRIRELLAAGASTEDVFKAIEFLNRLIATMARLRHS